MHVRSLALLSGLRIPHCRKLWCRLQMLLGLALLWLWCRLAATVPMWPLAWEPPYATGASLKRQKKKGNFSVITYLIFTFIKSPPFFSFQAVELNKMILSFLYCLRTVNSSRIYKNIGKNFEIICIWWHFSPWCEHCCMFFSAMIAFTRYTMSPAFYFTERLAMFTKGWQLYSN